MKLNPRVLGEVKISLLVEQGQITASFVVENQSVKELLQRSLGQLQQMLGDQGFDIDQIDVSVSDQNSEGSESGKAFASVEDQKAAREYLASFAGLNGRGGDGSLEIDSDQEEATDPDQILNVVA